MRYIDVIQMINHGTILCIDELIQPHVQLFSFVVVVGFPKIIHIKRKVECESELVQLLGSRLTR